MANTLISYNGENAFYNNDNIYAPFLSTPATGQIYLNSNCYGAFSYCNQLQNLNFISEFNFDLVENASSLFQGAIFFNESFNGGGNIIDGGYMFYNCQFLNKKIDLSSCTKMKHASYMFVNCHSLAIPPTLPDSIEDAAQMFYGCNQLNENIVLPANLKNAFTMFGNCNSLNQNIKIPQGTIQTAAMFQNCSYLNQAIQIPNSVQNTRAMFANCININEITLPASIRDAAFMFRRCNKLQNIFININDSQITHNFVNLVINKNNSRRLNIWCNNLAYLNKTSASTSIVGNSITWYSMTNGYYNAVYNIYLYRNYTGNT